MTTEDPNASNNPEPATAGTVESQEPAPYATRTTARAQIVDNADDGVIEIRFLTNVEDTSVPMIQERHAALQAGGFTFDEGKGAWVAPRSEDAMAEAFALV